jgi:hypothetical protein
VSLDVRAKKTSPDALPFAPAEMMDLPTFLRLFQLRKAQVMKKRVPLSFITDPGDPSVQRKMQAHFDAQAKFPGAGAEDEYSFLCVPIATDQNATQAELSARSTDCW